MYVYMIFFFFLHHLEYSIKCLAFGFFLLHCTESSVLPSWCYQSRLDRLSFPFSVYKRLGERAESGVANKAQRASLLSVVVWLFLIFNICAYQQGKEQQVFGSQHTLVPIIIKCSHLSQLLHFLIQHQPTDVHHCPD